MNYQITSQSGWRAGAHTREEALEKADQHRRQWAEIGRTVGVHVYYRDGTEISTPTPCPGNEYGHFYRVHTPGAVWCSRCGERRPDETPPL